jgi:hypothetical protein
MYEQNLLMICLSAFIAVFVLLTILAVLMQVMIKIFPAKITQKKDDAALYAAIASTMQTIYPGTKITKIEEEK